MIQYYSVSQHAKSEYYVNKLVDVTDTTSYDNNVHVLVIYGGDYTTKSSLEILSPESTWGRNVSAAVPSCGARG